MWGTNVDPLNATASPTSEQLRQVGLDHVRLVARLDPASIAYAEEVYGRSINVLPVLAKESFTEEQIANEDYQRQIGQLRMAYWFCDLWEVGNEPDSESESSWTLTPAPYVVLFRQAQAAMTGCQLMIGGLANGEPESWLPTTLRLLHALDSDADLVGIHPYAKTASEARAMLIAYQEVVIREGSNATLWATEWNRPAPEIAGFMDVLAEFGAGTWFAWSDGQVNGMGLVTYSGDPKPEYFAMQAKLRAENDPMRTYQWALGAENASKLYGCDTAFGPPVVTAAYENIYPGLGNASSADGQTGENLVNREGAILCVTQLIGVAGEARPRGRIEYNDVGPSDGWDGWAFVPFRAA